MTHSRMMTRIALATIAAGVLWSHSICHAVIVINADPNPMQNTPFVSQADVYGDMMTGMTVTAHFSNRPSETVPWLSTGNPQEGHATGPAGDWKLGQAGDTFSDPWTLQYLGQQNGLLTGLTLDGMAAGALGNQVVFDRTNDYSGDNYGTPGSYFGTDFTTNPNPYPYFDIHVTYKGEVAVSTAPNAYGDIYRFLEVHFHGSDLTGNIAGLDGGDLTNVVFRQDTDTLSSVPEPSTLAMATLAVGILGVRRRRIRRPAIRPTGSPARSPRRPRIPNRADFAGNTA